ncbi:MAG: helix-turn-helix domain-containing protein [Alphaproteobacteria bacterium]|nr:helix-turn-helix domain-containing protein [Alphaproteobacteria bacterium]
MNGTTKNEAFHQRLTLLIGTEEPFRWAKRMGIPGATFARIWNNYDIPKHEHLCRIAQRCDVSLDWLLMGNGEKASLKEKCISLPLLGLANCGIAQGWFNETELQDRIILPSFMAEENAFAVRCRGRSMVPAGIEDGNVCLIYPNRPVEAGKPTLIRTKSYIKGREVSLATIKVFDSEDKDAVMLSGWLDPDETGYQSLFTEKRLKNCITMIAPVGNVLPVEMPENTVTSASGLSKELLTKCLDTLRPLYQQTESSKFAEAILFLYDKIQKNEQPDMKILQKLMEIIGGKG